MDFELVLKTLLSEFSRLEIRSAAIGGFALGVLGVPRQTMDLDFLVHRDDLDKLDTALRALGYNQVFHSENVRSIAIRTARGDRSILFMPFEKFHLACSTGRPTTRRSVEAKA